MIRRCLHLKLRNPHQHRRTFLRHTNERAFHEKVLKIGWRLWGEEHPDVLTSMKELAMTLQAQGNYADLLLLDGDPLADISNTRRIAGVWKSGRLISDDGKTKLEQN